MKSTIQNRDLVNRITRVSITQAEVFAYVGKNYDITVGSDVYLTGIGSVGYGYLYNRCSGVYNIQHYYCLGNGSVYERIIPDEQERTWTKLVTASDFTDTTIAVNTVKDTPVAIPGAPSTSHYVPVVVGHVSTNNTQDNVFWDGKWWIYSSTSQITQVKFHKIPK